MIKENYDRDYIEPDFTKLGDVKLIGVEFHDKKNPEKGIKNFMYQKEGEEVKVLPYSKLSNIFK